MDELDPGDGDPGEGGPVAGSPVGASAPGSVGAGVRDGSGEFGLLGIIWIDCSPQVRTAERFIVAPAPVGVQKQKRCPLAADSPPGRKNPVVPESGRLPPPARSGTMA